MFKIRVFVLVVMGISFLMAYSQSTNSIKRDSTVTKSRLADGVKLGEVEVVGNKKFGLESSQMSAIQLSQQQIKLVPMFMGTPDVLKALQKLPGVNSEGEGTVGISVRGGNIDQNLITLDGATLYNPEHLKGYASAINPDMVGNIDFYRGAFPARYGSRLSSVIDVTMKEGDFKKYHGSLFLGALSGSAMIEGPIWKNHTSFCVGGRMSYFDLLAYPALEKVYDNPDKLRPYSEMKYFDINAKITHKFSERNRLSASFYYGKDNDNTTPTDGAYEKISVIKYAELPGEFDQLLRTASLRKDSTATAWSNMCGALNWNWDINNRFSVGANVAYSKYDYSIIQRSYYKSYAAEDAYPGSLEERDPYSLLEFLQIEDVNQDYFSKVEEGVAKAEFGWEPNKKHNLHIGVESKMQEFTPQVRVKNDYFYKDLREDTITKIRYVYTKGNNIDTIMGGVHQLKQYSLYAEDNYELSKNVKLNIGVRLALHAVQGKTYSSFEPRLSMRWKFLNDHAVKLSYSRMAQSTHRLATNNLVSTSELWVPITKDIPLMKSDLVALGYVYDILPGMSVSAEAYYKTMENIIEYKQNANYSFAMRDWSQMVSVGNGRSYGVEFMLEKTTGNTTGWVSYTWSKALRKFDRAGNQLNGGKEFYANNDCRNNLNIMISQKIPVSKKSYWELNASWSYQTGRRGTIPVAQVLGGRYAYFDGIALERFPNLPSIYRDKEWYYDYNKNDWHIYDALRMAFSTRELNNYQLPDVHHLDLGVNFAVKHLLGESVIGLSVYNAYNRMNANTAYVGFNDKNELVLKTQCSFPIMPSISYTHKF